MFYRKLNDLHRKAYIAKLIELANDAEDIINWVQMYSNEWSSVIKGVSVGYD